MIKTTTSPESLSKVAMTKNKRFFMCRPTNFSVDYVINPWMEGNLHRPDASEAMKQWEALHQAISEDAEVELIDQGPGMPDLVFTANAGLVFGNHAIPSHFRHPERQVEEPVFTEWFRKHDFEVTEMPRGMYFEGAGDALFLRNAPVLVMGYGFRTVLESATFVSDVLGVKVVPVKLSDDRFYHLDTCFCPLSGGKLIWYPDAFDNRSVKVIESLVPEADRYAVCEKDALNFACNAVDTGTTVVLNQATEGLVNKLHEWGFRVFQTPLTQFLLSGGSSKCLTLKLNELKKNGKRLKVQSPVTNVDIEFRGHIIDEGTLTKVMDIVPMRGGSYRVDRFEPGFTQTDPSYISMQISAPGKKELDAILNELIAFGGVVQDKEVRNATFKVVEKNGVAPEDFYSTTIFPTEILHEGDWLRIAKQRMDATVVLKQDNESVVAECCLIRDLKTGDQVLTGSHGIRVHTKRDAEEDEFRFMSSSVSSERRVESAVDHVAWEMKRIHERGGRIVFVAGPVVIHTGGGPYLKALVREGYVNALLGGNAIAVHDLESQLYGTSLGVDLKKGQAVSEGHRHHINTINTIRACGSIKDAVDQGVITDGLFYEIVKANVPFCLAGSIRDDGPLPDTVMDLVKAQEQYSELLQGAEMVVMLSSMLHSIGVGNMTPSGVRMICVDINPSVATKLADRGSVDSTPIVTDVGLFLHLLYERLLDEDD